MHLQGIVLVTFYSFLCGQLAVALQSKIPEMGIMCTGILYVDKLSAFQLNLTSNSTYRSNMNCTIYVYTLSSMRMMVRFQSVDIEDSVSCTKDRLTLYDGPSRNSPKLTGTSGVCGFVTPSQIYTSSKESMTMQFVSDLIIQYKGFSLMITPFTDVCKDGTHFHCNNNRCIDRNLTCNGWNNCGDNSDEVEGCGKSMGDKAGIYHWVHFLLISLVVLHT